MVLGGELSFFLFFGQYPKDEKESEMKNQKCAGNLNGSDEGPRFEDHGLDKTERIGEMGSRNFFLRQSGSSRSNSSGSGSGSGMEEDAHGTGNSSLPAPVPPQLFFSFIARRISKLGRRTRKIWKILGCMSCG
ncbi:hypothetical protein ACLOJK_005365 [Asimina triloba]